MTQTIQQLVPVYYIACAREGNIAFQDRGDRGEHQLNCRPCMHSSIRWTVELPPLAEVPNLRPRNKNFGG